MDIGKTIKVIRQKQDMTQGQLAERCNMSTTAICDLETGKSWPSRGTVERLCQAFGIPVSYILVASIEESDFPESKRVLYRALLEPLRNILLDNKEP